MRAITFHDVRDVRVTSVREPELLASDDALVDVSACAICGSDLHPYRGDERGLDSGTVLGHEFVGVVAALGPAVVGLGLGRRVASPFSTACGSCFPCTHGLPCRCERGELFGWVAAGRGLHGGQSERVRVPLAATTLVPIPDGVSDEAALLAGDVYATGTFAAELAGVAQDDVVAVVGCGPVGVCAVVAALARRARRVIALDRDQTRLGLAARFGAEPMTVGDDVVARVRRVSDGRGADAVLECVGSPAATRLAYDIVRPGGTIAAVGVHTESSLAVTPGEIYDKNLSYRAGRCPARRFLPGLLAQLARDGDRGLTALFSHRLPLDAGPDAYRMFDERRDACTKVLLRP